MTPIEVDVSLPSCMNMSGRNGQNALDKVNGKGQNLCHSLCTSIVLALGSKYHCFFLLALS